MNSVENKVVELLTMICGNDQVAKDPDVLLFETGLLDSFGVVEFIVGVEEQLGIAISITDFDREEWATPKMIAQKLEELR
jgi:D-alanine--poly(phosphoribitol) ligase subunit 2